MTYTYQEHVLNAFSHFDGGWNALMQENYTI